MTEREYIDATNLAKIRAAKAILRDLMPMCGLDENQLSAAINSLDKWEQRLNKAVKTEG